ncbi:hypothetical protein [Heyndrickxia oleronia]|uniref:Uncharacterized protein n=1 Tax=Heyndrickxia oleronia TaxID=38875 RepID=A0AAW6SRF2_9BACI|nr:hypothetical protein [Heyndrickxia oleronia]MDH5159842.1 hypothetical protein [Heyndrickxia oleronia]
MVDFQRLLEIKNDADDTLKALKESKHDGSPRDCWTDEYVAEVMMNQKWLIDQLLSVTKGSDHNGRC